jgi:hypothetical protein
MEEGILFIDCCENITYVFGQAPHYEDVYGG